MKMIHFITLIAVAVVLAGCNQIPFGPVEVPEYTMTRPLKMNIDDTEKELNQLQMDGWDEYKISSNDVFSIVVYGYPKLSRDRIMVTPGGQINFAPLGLINVSGLSLQEAGELLSEKLKKFIRFPNVALEPIDLKSYNFTISGKVNQPGIFPITVGSTRLADAIALARGLSTGSFRSDTIEIADLDAAYISRRGKILPVDFVKAITKGDILNNVPLQNGDYIYIPSGGQGTIVVLGEVRSPTYIAYQPNMTLLMAIGYANGLKDTNSSSVKVIRGGLKDPEVYTINISKILEGKSMDFELKQKDIVYIPKDGLSDWNVIMQELLPTIQVINGLAGPFGNNPWIYYNL